MTRSCPLCSGELMSRGVDADFGLSRCQDCNVRFELSSLARAGGSPAEAPPVRRRVVPLPSLAQVERTADRLHLRMVFSGVLHKMGLGAVLLLAPCIGLFAPSLHAQHGPVVSGPFFGMVLGLAYLALAGILNSRHVELTPGRLSIRVGPIPWNRRVDVRSSQLVQLYCVTHAQPDGYGGESYSYEVLAILTGERRLSLVQGLSTLPEALWIEQEIETFLGIRDERVPGSSTSALS